MLCSGYARVGLEPRVWILELACDVLDDVTAQLYSIFSAAARSSSDTAAVSFLKTISSPAAIAALKESRLEQPM
jgi:hypothetical protein